MTTAPHHTTRIRPLSTTELELFASLGADRDLAHRLARQGLYPDRIIQIDHPNPEQFADHRSLDPDDDDDAYLDSITRNFPAFDPAVLEQAATRPWRTDNPIGYPTYTPGPLNRYMTVRDAGISLPALFDAFNTFNSADLDRWAELDEIDVDTVLHIREDDIHITLSANGATWNQQTEVARVALALGDKPTPALQILDAWTSATRPSWPKPIAWRMVSEAACDVDIDGADPDTFTDTLGKLCDSISRRRFAALAPSLPNWFEAFAAEHPGHDGSLTSTN